MTFTEIAQLVTAGAAFGAFLLSMRNGKKIQEVHLSINSRMTQLLEETRSAAHAAGAIQQRQEDKETPREK